MTLTSIPDHIRLGGVNSGGDIRVLACTVVSIAVWHQEPSATTSYAGWFHLQVHCADMLV